MKTYTTNRKGILHRLMSFLGTALIAILMVNAVAFSQQAPVLESPADLATNQSTTVELKWFAAADKGQTILTQMKLLKQFSKVFRWSTIDASTKYNLSRIIYSPKRCSSFFIPLED